LAISIFAIHLKKMESNIAYLLLGSNLGDRLQNFERAIGQIELRAGEIQSLSNKYETEPWGFQHDVPFINQALKIATKLSARKLLDELLSIEMEMGRTRQANVISERIIDIDILLFNEEIIDEPGLSIPHPRLPLRKFALLPLSEIAADYFHPVTKQNIAKMLQECSDELTADLLQVRIPA